MKEIYQLLNIAAVYLFTEIFPKNAKQVLD